MGKILRVNLTTRKTMSLPLDEELILKYVGGYGTAGRILYDEVPPWAGAFDPSNLLIFSTGPMTGTIAPIAGRHTVVTKSPLTGYFGDANGGGFWGAELKFTGHDMIIINGRASKPVFLWIHDEDVEIRDASPYWGMDAREADKAIRSDLGDKGIRVADIGQGGENLVRFAGIMNDEAERTAARCGVGAVMGFMNLKAVAVRGHKKVPIKNEDELRTLAREITKLVKTHPVSESFGRRGTPGQFDMMWKLGDVPSYNWSGRDFREPGDPGVEKLAFTPEGYGRIFTGRRSCYMCSVACRRAVTVENGAHAVGENAEGPEYETMAIFGPNCGIESIEAVAKINDLCNRYSLDPVWYSTLEKKI